MWLKLVVYIIVLLCVVTTNAAGYTREEWQALKQGAEFYEVIKIIDDDGAPVKGAKVGGWMFIDNNRDHGSHYSAISDSDGCVFLKGRCGEWVSVVSQKDGYYTTILKIRFPNGCTDKNLIDGKWQPYGEEKLVVLKKIKKPTELVKPPHRINKAISFDEWYDYDLIENDWVAPYGAGKNADVSVRLGMNAKNDTSDFCVTMDLDFSNIPCSGVYLKSKDMSSEFKSDYYANANAEYKSHMSFKYERHPHKPVVDTRLDKDSYLVFRIRTKVDEKGNLVSAHYGKIYGPWTFFGAMNVGELYFNPTPNDTNLEDAETARKARLYIK